MKAYCINLDRRPDRLEHMTWQFAELGLPVERVSAVDGQAPEVAAEAARCEMGFIGRKMGPGAYACFQSHREFWRRLLASGDVHGMVLEDDLVITGGFADYLRDGWVPADADIVKLETYESRIHLDAGPGQPAGPRRLHRLRSRHPGTGCYVMSARAAEVLLRQTEGILDSPIDEYLFNEASPVFHNLVTYQMVPAPVIQGDRWKGAVAGWVATSITVRQAEAQGQVGPLTGAATETRASRLARRLREEWRARLAGTRYVVARHG